MEKIPDDIWDVAISSAITNLNFSKNNLTSLPEKWAHQFLDLNAADSCSLSF